MHTYIHTLFILKNRELVKLLAFLANTLSYNGRRGGLVVRALNSESSGLGSGPGWGHCVVFLGKTLYFHDALTSPPRYYKWVPANLMLGVTLQWTSIPSRGE